MEAKARKIRHLPSRTKRWAPRVRTGCLTCRARRLKCDESKPACLRCLGAKKECQGYLPTTADLRPVAIAKAPGALPQFDGSQEVQALLFFAPILNKSFGNVADDLQKKTFSKIVLILAHLPRRAGHKPVLDSAVRCFASGIRDVWEQNQSSRSAWELVDSWSIRSLALYMPAISKLQHALQDPVESLSAETLCAAVLLCAFDALRKNTFDTLKYHLIGITKLFHHRGPLGYGNDFELDLLNANVPFITLACAWQNKECYLNEDDWQGLTLFITSMNTPEEQITRGIERFVEILSKFVAECSSLVKQFHHDGTVRQPQQDSLLKGLIDAEESFTEWFQKSAKEVLEWESGIDGIISLIRELHEDDGMKALVEPIGGCIMAMISSYRTRIALNCCDSIQLVTQAQEWSQQVMSLHKEYQHDPSFAAPYYLIQFSKATLATKEEWDREIISNKENSRNKKPRMISAEAFGRWLNLAGVNFQL